MKQGEGCSEVRWATYCIASFSYRVDHLGSKILEFFGKSCYFYNLKSTLIKNGLVLF